MPAGKFVYILTGSIDPDNEVDGAQTRAMTVTIYIPAALRASCAGASELSLSAASVRAVLEQIERNQPALYRSICDETGAVRRHVNVFVNTSHMRDLEGLDTALASGDVITILPAVSGG
jgi:molybdopterin converting factor small subunit